VRPIISADIKMICAVPGGAVTAHRWDPGRYLAFADQRGRPFADLVARVPAESPELVVDLGCGPGNLTAELFSRWPDAEIVGVDSSVEMIARARATSTGAPAPTATSVRTAPTATTAPTAPAAPTATSRAPRIRFEQADLRHWRADRPVDVMISNATLQWVPGHLDLLPRLVDQVAPGGWLAFQVPGNFEAPSHRLLHELAAQPRFARHLGDVARPAAHDAAVYLAALLDLGCQADAWETTYLHLLQGADPVFAWVSGTGARPVLQALPNALRAEFEQEYRRLLREAYPRGEHGTVLPFRRVFAVARTPGRVLE
jgi:trans-aconitate 2-methyltransferase